MHYRIIFSQILISFGKNLFFVSHTAFWETDTVLTTFFVVNFGIFLVLNGILCYYIHHATCFGLVHYTFYFRKNLPITASSIYKFVWRKATDAKKKTNKMDKHNYCPIIIFMSDKQFMRVRSYMNILTWHSRITRTREKALSLVDYT